MDATSSQVDALAGGRLHVEPDNILTCMSAICSLVKSFVGVQPKREQLHIELDNVEASLDEPDNFAISVVAFSTQVGPLECGRPKSEQL
ncbi:hypothetical protein N9L68_02280 [bacterium]|nr:hypothetical protein [bacterium]